MVQFELLGHSNYTEKTADAEKGMLEINPLRDSK